jgi:fermentation-respiration switch protein FrsA (DUF1100 family)
MDILLKVLLGIGTIYLAVAVAAFLGQRALMYVPDPRYVRPEQDGLIGVEERILATPDGAKVIAWFGRSRPGQPTLLYFHGNAGSLSARSERIARYLARGFGIMMMTYRGYGGSTGRPSEAANVADAKLAYDALVASGVAPADIVLYGESIGTGVAVQLAASRPVGGVILDAPYTSIVDVAARAYPYLPVRPFLLDRYETMKHIDRIRAPLLIVHGERDSIIPVEMGREVLAAAGGPKQMITFPHAGHSDHHLYGSYEAITTWLAALRP